MSKINNMKYYSSSLAYDFDMFMPTSRASTAAIPERKRKADVVELPIEKKIRSPKAQTKPKTSFLSKLSTVVIIAALLGVVTLNIFLRAEITRVHGMVAAEKNENERLQNEYTRLNIEIDKKTNIKDLETKAAELGMKKRTSNQITYVKLSQSEEYQNKSADKANGEVK